MSAADTIRNPTRRRGRLLCVLLALVVSAFGVTVQTSRVEAAPQATIEGAVTQSSGGAAAYAAITATEVGGGSSFATNADSMGNYKVPVDAGSYCVSFVARQFDTGTTSYQDVDHCLDGAKPVVVGAGAAVQGVNGVLHTGEFSGTVRDAGGAPVVGALVYASRVGGTGVSSVRSGVAGAYTIRDVAPGVYCVFAYTDTGGHTSGGLPACDEGGRRLEVIVDTPVGFVDLTVTGGSPLGAVSGKVAYASTPVANRGVEAVRLDSYGSRGVVTKADGSYTIDGLPQGSYCVRVLLDVSSPAAAEAYDNADSCTAATSVKVGSVPVTGVDFALAAGGTIKGTVTSAAGTPLTAATVQIESFEADYGKRWTAYAYVTSGAYQFNGLPTGDYCVSFSDSSGKHAPETYQDAVDCRRGATAVHVDRGAVAVADAQLRQGGTIAGKVTVPAGIDVTRVLVSVASPAGFVGYFQPDATGTYKAPALVPGLYCVYFRAAHFSDLLNRVEGSKTADCDEGSGTIAVKDATTSTVDTTMQLGGSVAGWVITAAGLPIANADVDIRPLSGTLGDETDLALGESSGGRDDGSFLIRGIPPGTYCVAFTGYYQGVGATVLGDVATCDSAGAIPVTVVSGQRVSGLRITPRVVGHIKGTVSATDSRDLNGTRVELFAPGTTTPLAVLDVYSTDLEVESLTADSIAELNRSTFTYYGEAPPGTYCVKVTPPVGSGLAARAYASAPDCTSGFTPVVVKATEYTTGIDVTLEPRKPGDPGFPGGPGDPNNPDAVYVPLSEPRRLTDTRSSGATADGVDAGTGRVEGGSTHEVVVAGRAGVPAGVASVVLNVTAVDATAAGFVTVWPCGADRPLASNVNFEAGETRPNSVIAKVGTDGKVCVFASQTIDAVVDVAGYFPTADGFTPLTAPGRLTDTRTDHATIDGVDQGVGRVEAGATHEVVVAGRAGVPTGAASVVLNVTAVDATAAGFVTVWPCGVDRPLASNVNFEAGETRPNSVIAKVGTDGKVCVFSSQTIDAVVDVAGYFAH